MIVFEIDRNFFIVLDIRLKIVDLMFFSFLQSKWFRLRGFPRPVNPR